MSKIKRQSGIELLRIIAMIQIIFLHAYQYGLLHDASKAAGVYGQRLQKFTE